MLIWGCIPDCIFSLVQKKLLKSLRLNKTCRPYNLLSTSQAFQNWSQTFLDSQEDLLLENQT